GTEHTTLAGSNILSPGRDCGRLASAKVAARCKPSARWGTALDWYRDWNWLEGTQQLGNHWEHKEIQSRAHRLNRDHWRSSRQLTLPLSEHNQFRRTVPDSRSCFL